MNQKAQRQTLEWPPLLNMSDNHPYVDNSFRNVEKNNAPYINNMITPVWVKDTESIGLYDKDGHRYEITEGYLTRDGAQLFKVNNKMFVREDITEEMLQYHDYDATDDHIAYTTADAERNCFYISFNDEVYSTPQLYEEGVLVASRIRIIDNKCLFVAYYDIDDRGYIYILEINNGVTREFNKQVKWYRHQIRRQATSAAIYQEYTLENAMPIINIGKAANDLIAISLVSSYGKAINSSRNYFATYFLTSNDLYQVGDTASPTSETSSVVVTNTYSAYFRANRGYKVETINGSVISEDGTNYYKYEEEGVKGSSLTFPVTYSPTDTGNTVEIDGVTYHIYNYQGDQYDIWMNIFGNISSGDTNWSATITYDGTDYTGSYTQGDDHLTIAVPTFVLFRGETTPDNFSGCKVTWMSEDTDIPSNTWNIKSVNATRTSTSTVNAGWLVSPNIVLDSGVFTAFWCINLAYSEANNWNSMTLTNGSIIEEEGIVSTFTENNSALTYTISPTKYVTVTSDYNVARSNSFIANQNFAVSTVKLNNASATAPWTLYNNGGTAGSESTSSKYLEYSNSNTTDLRYYPGTTRDSTFNYFGDQKFSGDTVVGPTEDYPVFTIQGYRTPIKSADRLLLGSTAVPFNILYNVDLSNTCVPAGISYSANPETMGTLLTPWQSIDDDFYIVATHNYVIYRDKSNRYYKISIEEGNKLSALLDDRFILVNTTSYWNMFDTVLMKMFHYATDYNDRVQFGQTAIPTNILSGANSSGTTSYSRITATAINAAYRIMPQYGISSLLTPFVTRIRVAINAEKPFNCIVEESSDTQPIDIYYGNVGGTSAIYRYSIYPYSVYDRTIRFDLVDSSYTVSGNVYYSPNMFTQFINGAGNNDMVKETYSSFVLNYYDQTPFFLYSAATEVTSRTSEQTVFFVLQGQFYAFMNGKIYSMIYSNGAISQQDAIIDCRGMTFIGNNPQIAFFYSPRDRAIYSFTGDAILTFLYSANKFSRIGYDDNDRIRHWYDETTQSIYADTDKGLLVFGQKNTYLFEDFTNVTNVQFSNDAVTHITSEGKTINLVYYPEEDYKPKDLDFETSFYGIGSNEITSIDRWDIIVYDSEGLSKESTITVGIRSITDITVKSEEKTLKITPDMWDKWSHSALIRYVPRLQKGQGLRLYVKTPLTIQRIVPHIDDQGTVTPTRHGI